MTVAAYQVATNCGTKSAVPAEPVELFPASIQAVFACLQSIRANDDLYQPNEMRPSVENVEWAEKVLLRVLPRHYLVGAEIDTFHGEIHVSWEHRNKRVVAFLPAPNQLKIYFERVNEGKTEHGLRNAANPFDISGVLRWLFAE
jgi:hypothetical protein